MKRNMNEQYNYASPTSLSIRIATLVRKRMFSIFMKDFSPDETESVLDVGVTADRSYSSSNYLELLYPHKHRIIAVGLDDAAFLAQEYPGLRFFYANALELPFPTNSVDYVHSSAVWEHVGSDRNQKQMLFECLRVAKKGVFLTTPNRWFPIEFHTQLPLLHWLPKNTFRWVLRKLKFSELANEANLNLLTGAEISEFLTQQSNWDVQVKYTYLLGWPSNVILSAKRRPES
jgi:hypothetical protein